MSIAGQLATSGVPRPDAVDQALSAILTERSGSLRRWRNGPVALGCCGDATLSSIPAPIDDSAALFWGRADNRPELTRELGIPSASSDAHLALAAYRDWGIDFLDRFVGEFCCAIWDGGKQRLLLGRDFVGKRPLVYHASPHTLHFASEPRGLLAIPGIPNEVDEDTLAEWFARQPIPDGQTFRKDIRRVPPGHILIASADGLRIHRYWRPEEKPILRLRRDEDYAEAILTALEQAVASRLPAEGPVACTLSAGLDSPTVAALAATQLAHRGRTLTAFTAVPQPGFCADEGYPGRLCNEGPLAASIARRYPNIKHVLIPNNAGSLLEAVKQGIDLGEAPPTNVLNAIWFRAIHEESQRLGVGTFLVGQAGNGTISYDGALLLPSLLARGRLWSLGRELMGLRRSGASWGSLANQAIGHFLPPSSMDWIRSALGKEIGSGLDRAGCISPNFIHRSKISERYHRGRSLHLSGADSRLLRLQMLRRMDSGIFAAGVRREYGFQPSDPTADKRLVELCLSIPEEQYLQKGEPRSLIRRAMRGILPEDLTANRRIGLQSADWQMTLKAQLPDLLSELDRLARNPAVQHYLDLSRMRVLLKKVDSNDARQPKARGDYYLLLRALSAGLFIDKIENSRTS